MARCRVVGQERFAYFCALSKVSRRKGGTNTRHNQNNGYAPEPTRTEPNPNTPLMHQLPMANRPTAIPSNNMKTWTVTHLCAEKNARCP